MECYFAPEEPAWIVPSFRALHTYHMDALQIDRPEEEGWWSGWKLKARRGRRLFIVGSVWKHRECVARYRYRLRQADVTKAQQSFPLDALDAGS